MKTDEAPAKAPRPTINEEEFTTRIPAYGSTEHMEYLCARLERNLRWRRWYGGFEGRRRRARETVS